MLTSHKVGSDHFVMLPSEDFRDLDDYIECLPRFATMKGPQNSDASGRYLTNEIQVGASDAEAGASASALQVPACEPVQVNGGAQFRRVMSEACT